MYFLNIYVLLLIAVPIVFSLLYLVKNNKKYYKTLSILLCLFGTIVSVLLTLQGTQKIPISGPVFNVIESSILVCEILILVYLYYVSIKYKRWPVLALTIVQTVIAIYTELFMGKSEIAVLNVDKLSLVMLLIINIIGTLIVVFSDGYITKYENHKGIKSRQKLYYSVICIFLAAMNGLVLSDSLNLVYFFWEITTLASFLLISYNMDEEAMNSGFRALFLNIIGGICFSIGIILFKNMMDVTTLSGIIAHRSVNGMYTIPVFLLCIAGFAKSAQVPFHSWLLGAMVAPTPVSALLHSSTMVKAGVYLIIKLSPAYAGTSLGTMIAIYGALSFLICSAIAMSQRNAKKILAYSTIANLGLIISSAGIGTSLAVSAAIILIIFHAISKALLFLCAGEIEHTVGSRDIEDMAGLVHKAPMLGMITVLGIISMILPPFGVLVTKWLSIEAAAQNPIVAILIVLGSAFTTVYYVKWLGTILGFETDKNTLNTRMDYSILIPLQLLSVLILLTTIFITPIFNFFVSPEVTTLLGGKNGLTINNGKILSDLGSFNETMIYIIIIATIIFFLLIKIFSSTAKVKNVYMCGENNTKDDKFSFRFANGVSEKAIVSNLYLYETLNEKIIIKVGYFISIALILFTLIGGLL